MLKGKYAKQSRGQSTKPLVWGNENNNKINRKLILETFVDEEQDLSGGDGIDVSVSEELDYNFPENYDDTDGVDHGNESSDGSMYDEDSDGDTREDKGPGVSTYESDEEYVMKNPSLRKLFNKLLDERIKQAEQKGETSSSNLLTTLSDKHDKGNNGEKWQVTNKPLTTPKKQTPVRDKLVKSPSDTTIYAPALVQKSQAANLEISADLIGQTLNQANCPLMQTENESGQEKLIETISNFIGNIRMDQEEKLNHELRRSEENIPGQDDAGRKSDHVVLEAEKFKASIAAPPGKTHVTITTSLTKSRGQSREPAIISANRK